MWVRCKRACLLVAALAVLLGGVIGYLRSAAAQGSSNWLVDAAPALSKVVDLPTDTSFGTDNFDCEEQSYTPPGTSVPQTVCLFDSPLGQLTTEGQIRLGSNTYAELTGQSRLSSFMPSADPDIAVVSLPSTQTGNYMGVYRHLDKSALKFNQVLYGRAYYSVTTPPDEILQNPLTHEPLEISALYVAYSANGRWMVADMPRGGLVRVDMTDLSVKLFSAPLEPGWYMGVPKPSLAVSDDGRYVAAVSDFSTNSLRMYDLSTCEDQLGVDFAARQYCVGKDIWNGRALSGQVMGKGILSRQADLERPVRLRFVDDYSLDFTARYGTAADSSYHVARFVTTAPGEAEHEIGLLGMGDSYISGQGAFEYIRGTDTSLNPCHLSSLSYPFILGAEDFDSYNSVACSGARTRNVISEADTKETLSTYTGQVTDDIPENGRVKSEILTDFMPGYIYQQEFASTYKPEAILLSVGGDDIGFGDIVKACVANVGGDTCYDTYEDRAELVNEVDNAYPKLVKTYKTLREQSGGARLYVVGYPQIAEPGGNCGLNVHLNAAEVKFSAQLISYLDGVVQKAAATAGVFYVDTQHAFDGHRLCESGASAVSGLTAGDDAVKIKIGHETIGLIGSESYHPTPLGYQLLARTIAAATDNLAALMPTPTDYAVPVFDSAQPILRGVIITGRPIKWVTDDDTMTSDVVLSGDTQPVTVDGRDRQLQPGSTYQIVLHSDPVLLDEGGVDASGNIDVAVRIPAGTTPGYHTLHVYAKDMAGDDVDIQEVIYVADGSGDTGSCGVVPASGQDTDGDGVDDACDPEITASLASVSGKVSSDPVTARIQAAVVTTGVTEPATGGNSTLAPVAGTVLGDSTPSGTDKASAAAATIVSPAKVYRLDWRPLLEVGGASTALVALLWAGLHRRG